MGKQRYTLEQFEADKAAREERQAKEEEERRERAEKGAARAAWIRDGGSERDFERAWPELRDEARKRRLTALRIGAAPGPRGMCYPCGGRGHLQRRASCQFFRLPPIIVALA
jgi:hypothetical protein